MFNISEVTKEGYNHAVMLNLQQKGSKLSMCVREEVQSTMRYFYDQIAPTEAVDISKRHQDTPLVTTEFNRRLVQLVTSDWGDLIDKEDQLHFLHDPSSAYALNAGYALGRKKDVRIINALIGNAYSGPKGDIAIALPNEQTVAVDYKDMEEPAGKKSINKEGLTLDKLRKARELLDDADVDDDEEQFCIVTSKQISDLLKTTEITSDDYNTVRALVSGKIDTFMGFTFKRVSSAILPKDSDNKRTVICFAKSAIVLATDGGIRTDISKRADKRMATQVYASISAGAVRMQEKQVVRILAKEI